MRKTKKKRARHKISKMGRGLKLIGAAALAVLLLLAGLFVWIDRRVAARLKHRAPAQEAAVYSELFYLRNGVKLEAPFLRRILLERGLREAAQSPQAPGDFAMAGPAFEILAPPFSHPHGSQQQPLRISFNAESGALVTALDPAPREVALAPGILARLGGAEHRESELRVLAGFPRHLQAAVIAVEDQRFQEHFGIDLLGILRALWANLRAMQLVQGGSTLTQQLAKNMFFTQRRTLERKVLEAMAALSLELRLSKDEILELYLNEVFLGQAGLSAIHGFAAAARTFFGKRVEEITLGEAALLAGLVRAPSYYSPRKHRARAFRRQAVVLDRMLETGAIDEKQRAQAAAEKIPILPAKPRSLNGAFFQTALRKELARSLNLEAAVPAGVKVFTGFSPELQICAQNAVDRGLQRLTASYGPRFAKAEAGLVALQPFSGLVRAWVGGRDFARNQFDHVAQARRQLGSTAKPFVYLAALDRSFNPGSPPHAATALPDEPLAIPLPHGAVWRPENSDRHFRGQVTLRYALEHSLNVPTAYLAQRIGTDHVAAALRAFRVAEEVPAVPAIALGALDGSLLALTAAYAALANGGVFIAPRLYVAVHDGDDDELISAEIVEEPVADENAVYVVTDLLRGVIERGTGRSVRRLGYGAPAAGKTGTSDQERDAWFVGFTPALAAGVWIGFDDNAVLGLSGGGAAAPIWAEFMQCAAPFAEQADFIAPGGVVLTELDSRSGGLAAPACPREDVVREVFVKGTEPKAACRLHGGMAAVRAPRPDEGAAPPPRKRSKGLWEVLFGE